MRADDFIIEDIDDLRTQQPAVRYDSRLSNKNVEEPQSGTYAARKTGEKIPVEKQQNIVARGLKKLAGAAILGPLASSMGASALLAAGAGPGAVAAGFFGGLGFGTYIAFKKLGKKYKTKYQDVIQPEEKFAIKGKDVDEYLEESGLGNVLKEYHNKYFTQDALTSNDLNLIEIKYGLAAALEEKEGKELQEPPKYKCPKCGSNEEPEHNVKGWLGDNVTYTCTNCGYVEYPVDEYAETEKFISTDWKNWNQNSRTSVHKYQDELDAIKSKANDDFKVLRKYLHTASKELEEISNQFDIRQPTLVALYARINGDSPLNFLSKIIKNV